jgi:hypothetical protein
MNGFLDPTHAFPVWDTPRGTAVYHTPDELAQLLKGGKVLVICDDEQAAIKAADAGREDFKARCEPAIADPVSP